jgi:hypothetical protein
MTAATRVLCGGALAVVASLGLAGCAFLQTPIPEPEDLTCTWTGEDGESSFELSIYGGLTYKDIPWRVVIGNDREASTATISGEGTWTYGTTRSLRNSSGAPAITLEVTSPEGAEEFWQLSVSGRGDQIELYQWLGDPDHWENRFSFTSSDCLTTD